LTLRTNGAGVAVCGCGSELHIVCSGGCPEPDVQFRDETTKPKRDRHRKEKRVKAGDVPSGYCTYQHGCGAPVAEQTYHGRPTTKCVKHLAMVQKYEAARRAREVIAS
jgi:hypothetical protein